MEKMKRRTSVDDFSSHNFVSTPMVVDDSYRVVDCVWFLDYHV